MSKKHLARTAIEGGRNNKWERDLSNREVRSSERTFVSKVANDVDTADEIVIERRRKIYKEFKDKLHPVRRWMDKQVGRVWDEVHAELRARFDTRTTAGRHILFDHILDDVDSHAYYVSYSFFGYGRYFVDDAGILRVRAERYRRSYVVKSTASDEALQTWRAGRFVREAGNELFWVVPVWSTWVPAFCTGYRQDKKLSDAERKFYYSLIEGEKRLVQTPVRE